MPRSEELMAEADIETTACPLCRSSRSSIIHTFGKLRVVSCKDCGLSYLSPRMKEPAMRKLYERKDYFADGDLSGYEDYSTQERSLRLTARRFLRDIKGLCPKAESLLEVGCGYGFFLDEASRFFSRRAGTELSADAARKAEETSGADIYTSDLTALPASVTDFDVIVMINVIEHVYEPLTFLLSLRKRLKPGGRLMLSTPDIGSFWYKIMKKKWPSFKVPEHVVFYDGKSMADLLRRAEFHALKPMPFYHAFPLEMIARRLGMTVPGAIGCKIIWLPRVMTALSGRK